MIKLKQGMFITFEGSEGCGKSTQIRLLYNFLKKKGYKTVALREPGGTRIGEEIRRILLSPEHKKMAMEVEMLLYMSARGQLVNEVVLPALKAGSIVLCDRFLDSTIAYQGYGCGMDLKKIQAVADILLKGVKPDLTILLDLELKESLKRSGRGDRIEIRPLGYHKRVRDGYFALAGRFPERIKVIKGDSNIEETRNEIRKVVLNALEGRRRAR